MHIRSRNDRVELYCEHCRHAEQIKEGITPNSFMRRFRAFQRIHEWKCKRDAKRVAITNEAFSETAKLIEKLTAPPGARTKA